MITYYYEFYIFFNFLIWYPAFLFLIYEIHYVQYKLYNFYLIDFYVLFYCSFYVRNEYITDIINENG